MRWLLGLRNFQLILVQTVQELLLHLLHGSSKPVFFFLLTSTRLDSNLISTFLLLVRSGLVALGVHVGVASWALLVAGAYHILPIGLFEN